MNAETIDPTMKIGSINVVLGNAKNLWNPFKPAPNNSGIEIKKEYLAEDCLSRLRNIPLVIVTPDREIPGNKANT